MPGFLRTSFGTYELGQSTRTSNVIRMNTLLKTKWSSGMRCDKKWSSGQKHRYPPMNILHPTQDSPLPYNAKTFSSMNFIAF